MSDKSTLHDFEAWLRAEYSEAYTFISLLDYWITKFEREILEAE